MAYNGWLFWPDSEGMNTDEMAFREHTNWCEHAFNRIGAASDSLGDIPPEEEYAKEDETGPRCFNCGSPAHVVSACPEPLNHKLINLSRTMHNFFFAPGPAGRFHETEEWRLTRLRWLLDFKPGKIRGPELREALGLAEEGDLGQEVPWLYKMLIWGYPKGWTGPGDPRLEIEARILCHEEDTLGELRVYGEKEDEVEVIDLDSFDAYSELSETTTLDYRTSSSPVLAPDTDTVKGEGERRMSLTKIKSSPEKPIRWANYQTDLFLSDRLPVYNRRRLNDGMNDDSEGLDTHNSSIADHKFENRRSHLPWRHPGAFSTNVNTYPWTEVFRALNDDNTSMKSDFRDEDNDTDMDISD